ncbi:MAG TPA: CBS domain-containing protein [Polyangia bacterium]|nr:CBS domain-containing protein [Polyangia bacterium]
MGRTIRTILKGAPIKGTPITVQEDDSLALALRVMVWSDVRHLPVLKGEVLTGVVSERDIVRQYSNVGQFAAAQEKVSRVMSRPPITVGPDDSLDAAITLVADHGLGCLPVVEQGHLIGLVTRRDLLAQEVHHDVGDAPAEWGHLRVDDFMSGVPVTASVDDTISVVVDRMSRHGIRHIPVIDGEQRVIGMVSDRDVRTAVGGPLHAVSAREAIARMDSTYVTEIMTREPSTLPTGCPLSQAAAFFADHKVGALPIVDSRARLVGLISYADVLRAIAGPKANTN